MTYKIFSSFLAIVLFSGLMFAQVELTKEQAQIQSALETQLRAEQNKLDPILTEGTGILLVQDILV